MSVNVFPNDIFRTVDRFVTKPDMVMQHCEPQCRAEKLVIVTARDYIIKI